MAESVKNLIVFGFVLGMLSMLGLASLSSAQFIAASSANGALSLNNLYITPQPIVAGSNITISFNLFNSYNNALDNVNLQITSSNPILNVSPSNNFLINAIGSGQYGGLSNNRFIYTFHVPASLSQGEYSIEVFATYIVPQLAGPGYITGQSEMPIYFYVYGRPSIKITANPIQQISPGSAFQISLSAANTGTSPAKNVSIYLEGSNSLEVVGAQRFNIGIIGEGMSMPVQASMYANSSINNGTYYVNGIVSYQNDLNQTIQENFSLPVRVITYNPELHISIIGEMPPELFPGYNQTLTLDVSNIGPGTAKNATISFVQGNDIKINGVNSYFIGSLPPESSAKLSLMIQANKTVPINMTAILAKMEYFSWNGQHAYNSSTFLPIKFSRAASINITGSNSSSLIPGASYVPVTFTIRNTGNAPAQQVLLSLQTIYPITPADGNAYISVLEPGQSKNVTFFLSVSTAGLAGEYPVTLYEQWRQPNTVMNQQFSSSTNYFVNVTSQPKQASTPAYASTLVIIVVAIIVAYALYKSVKSIKSKLAKPKPKK
ncbi:MAG: COG1361 S-layer family protein [Candidatus Micrarchaeia archaeon]